MCRGETSSETTGVLGAFDLEAAKLLDFSLYPHYHVFLI
jgi:hypothetical protein